MTTVRRGCRVLAAAFILILLILAGTITTHVQSPARSAWPSLAGVSFERQVSPFPVASLAGPAFDLPFLGGLDVPRPQFLDIDGDGDVDLFVQEYSNQLAFFENVGGDGPPRYQWRSDRYQDLDIGEWYRFVDLDADGLVDLLTESPVSHIRHYRNSGSKANPQFTLVGELRDAGGEPMFMDRQNIPAIADLDCDGRLDMLVGRVEGVVDRYEAVAPGVPQFAFLTERYEGIEIIGGVGMPTARHGANALALHDFDGDGDQDLFWGDFFEPAVLLIENIGRTCSTPSFQVDPITLPFAADARTSGYNTPAPIDIDGDGDLDFFMGVIGGAFNPIKTAEDNFYFWERTDERAFELRTKRFLNGIDHGSDAVPTFADIDADGDLDLLVGSKIDVTTGSHPALHLYRNEGTSAAPKFRELEAIRVADAYNLAPAAGDLDGDGDVDLVVGTWNQDLLVLINQGTNAAPSWVSDPAQTIVPPRASHIIPTLGDLDGDGDLDLVVGQASGVLVFYRNAGTARAPKFELVEEGFGEIRVGRRSAPTVADVDGDGLPDLVIGHENSGRLSVARNTGTRSKPHFEMGEPLSLILPPLSVPTFADLDGDGVTELVVGTTSGGLLYFQGRK